MTDRMFGAVLVTVCIALLIYAFVTEAFAKHTLVMSLVIAAVVISGAFLLVKFPRVRESIKEGTKVTFKWLRTESDNKSKGMGRRRKPPRTPIPKNIERHIFERADNTCQYPGCDEKENLEIHHINGDRSDHRAGNLILLCKKHHGKADHGQFRKVQLEAWSKWPTAIA